MPPAAPFAEYILPVALAAPFAAGALLFAAGGRTARALTVPLALVGTLVPAAAAALLWARFDEFAAAGGPLAGYAGVSRLPFGIAPLGAALDLGVNGVSLPLFTLAALAGIAAFLTAFPDASPKKTAPVASGATGTAAAGRAIWTARHLSLLMFMHGGLLGMFATTDIFFIYLFHEFALIPTFLLMLMLGGIGRRTAAIQMAACLTAGAMASLAGIILLAVKSGAGVFSLPALRAALAAAPLDASVSNWAAGLLLLGFGALASLFPFHSWAPATYTEAPAPVSMLHAGVLKNFGLYGLVQIALPLAPAGMAEWAPVLFWLALGNILVIGFAALSQRRLKEMVSYLSVSGMGVCFLGVFAAAQGGGRAAAGATVLLMTAHGLSVAALFALARAARRRTGALAMRDTGGLAVRAPVLAALFIAAGMAVAGLPGFADFWGELGVFTALGAKLPAWKLALSFAGLVLTAVCALRAAAAVFLGTPSQKFAPALAGVRDATAAERAAAGILLAASLAAGFWPRLVGDRLDAALAFLK